MRYRKLSAIVGLAFSILGCDPGTHPTEAETMRPTAQFDLISEDPVDLGTLPGMTSSYALEINEVGQVIGMSYCGGGNDGMDGFFWDPQSGMSGIVETKRADDIRRIIDCPSQKRKRKESLQRNVMKNNQKMNLDKLLD